MKYPYPKQPEVIITGVPGYPKTHGRLIESQKWRDGRTMYAVKIYGSGVVWVKRNNLIFKNPPSICEYCRLIDSKYRSASTPKDRRHALARFRLHRRQLHKNPMSKRMRYNLRRAEILAKRLYHHFKGRGVPGFIIKRIPDGYRGIVEDILKYNGVRVTYQNPSMKPLPPKGWMIRTKTTYLLGNGVKAVYLPANQAFLLMWHTSVLKGPASYEEIKEAYNKIKT